jgi:hypothetical protein
VAAAFGTGARLKFARGDRTAAERRLAEGLQIARELQLPRFEARMLYEQIRLAALSHDEVDGTLAARVMSQGGGTGDVGRTQGGLTDPVVGRWWAVVGARRGVRPSAGAS